MMEVLTVAAASYAAHSLLDALPPAAVHALLSRFGARSSDGFDLRMWLHSLLMGAGGLFSFLVDAAHHEPQASFQCEPPPSFLSWALPAAEMGYAVHDLRDAMRIGNPSFIFHGAFVGSFLALMFYLQVAHHITVVFTVHLSSVFLNLRRVDFGMRGNTAVDVGFAASFVVLRLLFLPILWLLFLRHAYQTVPSTWGACMLGGSVVPLAILGGVLLHGLNAYWGVQIVLRVRARVWRDADGVGRSGGAEGHYHKSRTT